MIKAILDPGYQPMAKVVAEYQKNVKQEGGVPLVIAVERNKGYISTYTMDVYADGQQIGKITDVLDYPGNKVYVVSGEHEYMIPAVKAFVLSTDMDSQIMQVKLIQGMRSDED